MQPSRGARIVIGVTGSGMILTLALSPPVLGEESLRRQREQIGEVLGKPVYRDEIRTGKNINLDDELHRLFAAPVMQKYCQQHKAEITPTEAEISAAAAYFDKRDPEERKNEEPAWRRRLKTVKEQLSRHKLTKEERQRLNIERIVAETQLKDEEPKLRRELTSIKEQLTHSKLTKEERQELDSQRIMIETLLQPPGRDLAHFIVDNWKLQLHLYKRFGGGRLLWQQAGTEAFDAMLNWLETHERQGSFKITDPKLRDEFYRYWHRSHRPFMIEDKDRIREEFLEPEWVPRKGK
jgi:hypothetical protein